ncbi:MAG: hypothetical protein MI862_26135 [Desulfobacterales bacterium]|nr:hypothetical protein [Desulfobacterales bacterium]
MDSERTVWKGQKAEKKEQKSRLKLAIEDRRNSIRTILNPHTPILEIDQNLLSQLSFELSSNLIEYKRLEKEIAAINKSLGIVE